MNGDCTYRGRYLWPSGSCHEDFFDTRCTGFPPVSSAYEAFRNRFKGGVALFCPSAAVGVHEKPEKWRYFAH